jgi:hypothetical protein
VLSASGCFALKNPLPPDGETASAATNNGNGGGGPPPELSISPGTLSISGGATYIFGASGGTPPYAFSIVSGSGTINASTGLFTPPGSAQVVTIRVSDANLAQSDAVVTVYPTLEVNPVSADVLTGETITVNATGGVPPLDFQIVEGPGVLFYQSATSRVFKHPWRAAATTVRVTDGFGVQVDSVINKPAGALLLGTSGWDYVHGMARDSQGFVYVVGEVGGPIDGQAYSTNTDAFVRKLTPYGGSVWTRLIGTSSYDAAHGVAIGPDDDVYVVGETQGTVPLFIGGRPGFSAGNSDGFVAKFDKDGNAHWQHQFGTTGFDSGTSIAVHPTTGESYVLGVSDGGSFEGVGGLGSTDIVLKRLDATGAPVGSPQRTGSSGSDVPQGMVRDPSSGNLFVVGYTAGNYDNLNVFAPSGLNTHDVIVASFSPTLGKLNRRQFNEPGTEIGRGIAYDGNWLYITGSASNGINGLVSVATDAFVLQLSPSLLTTGATTLLGTNSNDNGRAIAVDSESVYVAGVTEGVMGASAMGGGDVFVAKLAKSAIAGAPTWTQQNGTAGWEEANCILPTLGDGGAVYVGGYTSGDLDGVANAGEDDGFVAKYDLSTGAPQ